MSLPGWFGLLSLVGCESYDHATKVAFEQAYTCPTDRVTVTYRADLRWHDVQSGVADTPPPEIAADPARLALWQAKQDSYAEWNNRNYVYEAAGCDHHALFGCAHDSDGWLSCIGTTEERAAKALGIPFAADPAPAPSVPTPPGTSPTETVGDNKRILGRVTGAARACLNHRLQTNPDFTAEFDVTVELTADGAPAKVAMPDADPEIAACIQAKLATLTAEPGEAPVTLRLPIRLHVQ
jgi:hypothetical protein